MKTRVASSVVVSETRRARGGRSELKAFKVVSDSGETKYFAEARPAHAWASRMASKIDGKVKLFENAGGETFVFLAAYEDMRPLNKRGKTDENRQEKRAEALWVALGNTSQECWEYALKNPNKVATIHRSK